MPVVRPGSARKREAIIEAAARCFLARGYSATSMESVAAEAAVAKQTVYHHFGSKIALFEATLYHVTEQVTQSLAEAGTPRQSPEETLTRFGRHILDLTLKPESIAFLRLLISEAPKLSETADALTRLVIDGTRDTLSRYLGEETAGNRLAVDDPQQAARFFLGMLAGDYRLRGLLGVHAQLDPGAFDEHVRSAVTVFLRAYTPG